jgi:hypothetical protein
MTIDSIILNVLSITWAAWEWFVESKWLHYLIGAQIFSTWVIMKIREIILPVNERLHRMERLLESVNFKVDQILKEQITRNPPGEWVIPNWGADKDNAES